MRVSNRVLVLISAFAIGLCGQAPTPHAGWAFVPGGENLLVNGYWDDSYLGPSPVVIQLSNGVLTADAVNGYLGGANTLAPRLENATDFGVVATIQTAPGMNGLVTITGTLANGAQYWQGATEVEFGADNNGNYVFAYWDGTQANPNVYQTLHSFNTPPTGTLTMELLHQGGQFFVYFNGVQYGAIADPGLFTAGAVFPGFVLFPNQQMTMTQLAYEVPTSNTTTQLFTPVGVIPFTNAGDTPGSLMAATGRTFGDAANAVELVLGRPAGSNGPPPNAAYAPDVMSQFDALSAATMYYFDTETSQGDFTFGLGDALLADAKQNGVPVHCHHLIGPNSYLPAWLVNGTFTADQLKQIMVTHIQTVVGHFKGQCSSWDVVNEALNSDGTLDTSSKNVWANVIGPSYIDLAFSTARQADPAAKLYYNEYGVENQTTKTTGLYTLLTGMQQRGTPIDGVGLQCHWDANGSGSGALPSHDSMVANMAHLAAMGLSARLSELDARLLLPATAPGLATGATIFSTTVQACLDSPNCTGITVWGADDGISWIPAFFPGYGAATMFDASFQPKPAYTSVMNTLHAAATVNQTSTLSHVADGNGFDTLVLLINTGTTDANYTLQFYDQTGATVVYPLDPAQAGMSGVIHAGSQAIIRTTGSGNVTHLGWGQLTAPPLVKGMVIYQQQASATSLQEGSAPIAAPSNHLFVPFDNMGALTSIGFVNPSSTQTATVNFTVRYDTGGTDMVPAFHVNPLQQIAELLSGVWAATAGKRGMVEVNSSTPLGLVAFRFHGAAFTLVDTISDTSGNSTPVTSVIAHSADGNNFRSTFLLTNSGTVDAPYTLNVLGPTGQPVTFGFDVASPLSGVVPAGTTLTIDTTGLGAVTQLGWVELQAPRAVGGIEVFRQTNPGKSEQQATIPISQSNLRHFFAPFDNAGNTTAIALANPDAATAANINVTLRFADGTSSMAQLVLPPSNYGAEGIAGLLPATAGKVGIAEFDSNIPIAVVEVRFNPTFAFTSLRAVAAP